MSKYLPPKNLRQDLWVTETHQEVLKMSYRISQTLFSKKSEFQQIDIVETEGFGKMLLNDGLVMVTERDEFVYHDMIAHVPLFVHPNPKNVLIIGGGDGGSAREVTRHQAVEKCVMVEIDPVVIEGCEKHLPTMAKGFKDPKTTLLIQDGIKFVNETQEKFDVVIVDSTDPFGPAEGLFNKSFYESVEKVLNDDGIVVSQGESPFYEISTQKEMLGILNDLFPTVCLYNFNNLTYPGGLWSFTFASKKYHPRKDFDSSKVKASEMAFNYYNADIHHAAFCLPEFMKKDLGDKLNNWD